MTEYYGRKTALHAYRRHRETWDTRASYHLTRARHARNGILRLISTLWLIGERVPLDGKWRG